MKYQARLIYQLTHMIRQYMSDVENIETVERQQVLLVEATRGVLTAVNVSY